MAVAGDSSALLSYKSVFVFATSPHAAAAAAATPSGAGPGVLDCNYVLGNNKGRVIARYKPAGTHFQPNVSHQHRRVTGQRGGAGRGGTTMTIT